MTDILQKERCRTEQLHDIVVLILATHQIKLYYQTALKIAHSLRVASKLSMRFDRLPSWQWRNLLAQLEFEDGRGPLEGIRPHREYRRSGELSNLKTWRVDIQGTLVVLTLDDLTIKLPYADALQLHSWLRQTAHAAKAWAGDPSKGVRSIAYLNDAEENYRHGW